MNYWIFFSWVLSVLFYVFGGSFVKYIYIYNFCIFLMYWPFSHGKMLCLIRIFCLKSNFFWSQYNHSSSFGYYYVAYLFPFFYLQLICVLDSKVSVLWTAYSWIIFLFILPISAFNCKNYPCVCVYTYGCVMK